MMRLRSWFRWRAVAMLGALALMTGLGIVLGPALLHAPRVVRITPADGTASLNPAAAVEIVFDQWVRPDSVRAALRLEPPSTFTISSPQFRAWGTTRVHIQPAGPLSYGTRYRLVLDGSVRNLVGRALVRPLDVSFTTLPYVAVKQVAPAQAAAGIGLRTPITVEFGAPVVTSEEIAAAADNPERANALPQPLTLAPATSGVGRWLTPTLYGFYSDGDLLPATTYSATVPVSVTADGRAQLERPVTWSFVTGTPPSLVGTRPFDGANDVDPAQAVEIRLAHFVDTASARPLFSLRRSGDAIPVAGTVETRADQLFFTPAAPLEHGARYEARLAGGLRSAAGAPLATDPLQWIFTVVNDPVVVEVAPPANATDVLTATRQFRVRFSQPIVALQSSGDQNALPQPLTITPTLPGRGQWLTTSTYVYSPTAALAPATTYAVRVAAGLTDQTGGTLRADYTWQFSTIAPRVRASVPQPDAQFVGPSQPITVTFNQAMDRASLPAAFEVRRVDTGEDIVGSVTLTGAVATWRPTAPLEPGQHTLTVATSARSANGAALAAGYTAGFRVAPVPGLVGSSPLNGATGVAPGSSVNLSFSAPMDWGSVERVLVIEPRPAQVYTQTGEVDLTLDLRLQPETDYRVTVGAAARDIFGRALGSEVVVAFRTGSLPAALSFVGAYQIGAYNAYVPASVPLRHVGTPEVKYSLYRLDPVEATGLLTDYELWQKYRPRDQTTVKDGIVALPGGRNEERLDSLALGQFDAGLYYLVVLAGDQVDRQIMVVSPYAVTIKRSAGELFMWVVDLQTGRPVADLPWEAQTFAARGDQPDAPVVLAAPRALGRTDGEGILRTAFSAPEPYDPVFLWSAGERFGFATTNWGEGIGPWDYGLPGDVARRTFAGSLYTDRPIYRPAQTVSMRGALRTVAGERYELPATSAGIQFQVVDSQGHTVLSTTLELSDFGTFNTELRLDTSAALGSYSMRATLAGDASGAGLSGSFNVAEYRKPQFEIMVTPATPDVIQGETVRFDVDARYFAAGGVGRAPVRWRLLSVPLPWSSESAPNYSFGSFDDAYDWYRGDTQTAFGGSQLVSEGTGTTDAQGRLTLQLPTDASAQGTSSGQTAGQAGSHRLTLDVEVTDVDGQVIASQGTVEAHPGQFYLGLRPEGYVAQAGREQLVSILALDWDERPVATRAVTLQFFKREWFSVREQGPDGRLYWTSQYTDTLVDTRAATTDAQGRSSAGFTPKDGGSYRILAEARDQGGRTIRSNAFTWAYGGATFWGVDDTNRVDLVADKTSYRPGDTARILVPAPYPGMSALMTIERGTVLEHRLLTLTGTTEVLEIPLTGAHAPNVFVSVVLIKPAGGTGEQAVPRPDLRVGLVNLPVATDEQELGLTISPDTAQAGPRDTVTYTIKATDHTGAGVRAEVGLALVDKAVLTLADDPNPSLRQAFYDRRPLGVVTSQSLLVLVDRVRLTLGPGGKGGASGDVGGTLLRRELPDTAYWNPAVVTGSDGTAQITVTLPDNLTTWHMSARGLTADTRVGQATNELVATKPLFLRPSFPRFLTVGDRPTLQAVVHNTTPNAVDATVTLEAGTLTLTAPAIQVVAVPANGQAVVRWSADVTTAGEMRLVLSVRGGEHGDAIEQTLRVQRYLTPEVVASAGQVGDSPVAESLDPPQGPEGTRSEGSVEVELVPSLAAGVETGLDYLETFPYACTEQSVSRFLPNAVTLRLYRQLGVDDIALKSSLERSLAAGLQQLFSLQQLDGGWGWWANDESNPYLTAYVVQGLVEVGKAGYSVEPSVLEDAFRYLEKALAGRELSASGDAWRANARAYTLFVLGEAGRADGGRTVALFEERAKLYTYGRAYLLMALQRLGVGQEERVRTLIGELTSSAIFRATDAHWEEPAGDEVTMSTDTRSTALALQALVRADPSNMLVPNAVRYLMTLRDQGHWSTTQESAVTLMALAEYLTVSGELEGDYTYGVALDGRALKEGVVTRDNLRDPISLTIALADLKAGGSQLAFERRAGSGQTGKGRLHYTLRMRSYEDAASIQPLDQGLAVQREYIAVDTVTLTPTGQLVKGARLGEVVQVRLTLNVPTNMHYFVVEDMLPAGLEALDTSLKTVTAAANDPSLQGSGGDPYWSYWGATTVRDDRVALFATTLPKGTYHYTYLARATTAGAFKTLPATAYQMYAPEVFGRSAGTEFVVTLP